MTVNMTLSVVMTFQMMTCTIKEADLILNLGFISKATFGQQDVVTTLFSKKKKKFQIALSCEVSDDTKF